MFWKIVLLQFWLISSLLALGGLDSLPDDQKKIADAIKTTLELNNEDTLTLYKERIESYFNTTRWSTYYYDNNEVKNNKISKSENKTMFLTFLRDDRIINISFVKFANEKQIIVYVLETLPRTSQIVLEKFNELEKNKGFKKISDAPNFAYFNKDGVTSKVNIFASSPTGTIQYSDYYLYSISK